MDFNAIKNHNVFEKITKIETDEGRIEYLNTLIDIGFSILEANTDTGHIINLKEILTDRLNGIEEMIYRKEDPILPIDNTIKLHNLELEQKFTNETQTIRSEIKVLSDHFTKLLTPVVKGGVSEDIVEKIFNNLSSQCAIEKTAHISHKGDFIIDGKIMLDVKNYSQTVPQKETNKLVNDLKRNDMDYGMLISINSSISGSNNLPTMVSIDRKKILLIPSMSFDINTLFIGILFINYIHEMETQKNNDNETAFLEVLDEMNDIISHNKSQRSKIDLILKTGKELQKDMVNIELKMTDLILKLKSNTNISEGIIEITELEEKVKLHPMREPFLLFVNEIYELGFNIDKKLEIYNEKIFIGKINILKNKINITIKEKDIVININNENIEFVKSLL